MLQFYYNKDGSKRMKVDHGPQDQRQFTIAAQGKQRALCTLATTDLPTAVEGRNVAQRQIFHTLKITTQE